MEKIILVGGGGHCLSVIDSIERANLFEIIGIIDIKEKVGLSVGGYKVIGTDDDLNCIYRNGIENAFISLGSIGNTIHRKKLFNICREYGYKFPAIIDPSAIIASKFQIGEGIFIGKGVIINREVSIGDHAILNSGCIIEHNCYIGAFAHIAPGAKLAGNVSIGDSTHIGIGTTIIQNVRVGNNVIIGASSNVIYDISDNNKAYGNPCRVVEKR